MAPRRLAAGSWLRGPQAPCSAASRSLAIARGRLALHRAQAASEHLRGLGLGQVIEVAQHQHRALPRRQRRQRPQQVIPVRHRGSVICHGRAGETGRHRPLRPPNQPPPPVSRCVGKDPADVPLRLPRPADPRPMPVRPFQRQLKQILRIRPVLPGQQQRGPQQGARPGVHEVLEGDLGFAEPHTYLTLPRLQRLDKFARRLRAMSRQAASRAPAARPRRGRHARAHQCCFGLLHVRVIRGTVAASGHRPNTGVQQRSAV